MVDYQTALSELTGAQKELFDNERRLMQLALREAMLPEGNFKGFYSEYPNNIGYQGQKQDKQQ